MQSWLTYEQYSGSLGIQTLTDITGNHFGPSPASTVGANGLELATSRLGWNIQRRTEPAYQAHIHPKLSQCTKTLTPLPITSSCGSTTSITRTPSIPGKQSSDNSTMHIYNGTVATQTFLTMWESLKGKIDDECYNHIHYC
jgi:alpha-glucuronidase